MSSDVDSSINQDNLDIDSVIVNVKQEFKNFLIKREQLVIKLGKALENEHQNKKENICAEIKGILRQEVADGLISRRDIERYSLDEWKKNTKPKKEENDKLSFSRQQQEAIPLIIDTNGNSVTEQAAIPSSDSNNNDAVKNEGSANEEVKHVEEFHAGNELGDVIRISDNEVQQQLLSEQGSVKKPETNIEVIDTDLEIKSNENDLQSQIEDLTTLKARPHVNHNQEDKLLDIQFEIPFERLRKHMESCLSKHIKSIWFFAKVDLVTKNIHDVQLG